METPQNLRPQTISRLIKKFNSKGSYICQAASLTIVHVATNENDLVEVAAYLRGLGFVVSNVDNAYLAVSRQF